MLEGINPPPPSKKNAEKIPFFTNIVKKNSIAELFLFFYLFIYLFIQATSQ